MAYYEFDLKFATSIYALTCRAAATSLFTIVLPTEEIEIAARFNCCNGNGIPMIVIKRWLNINGLKPTKPQQE
jgi:hypothetical protein